MATQVAVNRIPYQAVKRSSHAPAEASAARRGRKVKAERTETLDANAVAAASPASAAAAASTPAAAAAASSTASAAATYIPPSLVHAGTTWYHLHVPPCELRLDITLKNGQCFLWKRCDPEARRAEEEKQASKGKKRKRAGVKVDTEAGESEGVKVEEDGDEEMKGDDDDAMIDEDAPGSDFHMPAVKPEPIDVRSFFTANGVRGASPASASPGTAASAALAHLSMIPTDAMKQQDVQVKMEQMSDENGFSAAAAATSSSQAAAAQPVPLSDNDPHYIGVLQRSVIGIRQTADEVYYALHSTSEGLSIPQLDALLRDYFHLPGTVLTEEGLPPLHSDLLLSHLYPSWCRLATERFKFIAAVYPGVRVLRQDPVECLLSFICSSNNNIARITQMLTTFRREYGEKLHVPPDLAEQLGVQQDFHAFPTLEHLCSAATEARLRELGFGYRAKFLVQSVHLLHSKGGSSYLHALRSIPDRVEVERALLEFPGVGPKVAACVALFALDRLDAIPCDTHVWKIALRDYSQESREAGVDLHAVKHLNARVMEHVGDVFRRVFGSYAGWAHCLLFLAELPEFKRRLREMGLEVRHPEPLERERKKGKKKEKAAVVGKEEVKKPNTTATPRVKKEQPPKVASPAKTSSIQKEPAAAAASTPIASRSDEDGEATESDAQSTSSTESEGEAAASKRQKSTAARKK